METQTETIYNKLKKAASFMQQIPEDFRILYDFQINHLESDFVGLSFRPIQGNYVGTSVDNIKKVSVRYGEMFRWVEMETNGSSITLYQHGHTHITLF
jgi:hypothetical protein